MRHLIFVLSLALQSAVGLAQDTTQTLAPLPCVSSNPNCQPSKADLKKAKAAFARGLKLEKRKQMDAAFDEFDSAARLVPNNVNYVTALALVRQQLVSEHVQKGNAFLLKGMQIEAQAEFRNAVVLDPSDAFAQQRLRESLGEWASADKPKVDVLEDYGELRVIPSETLHSFHFRGDSHALLTQVAAAYGVTAEFDESVATRRVHFDIDDVDFYTAMRAAGEVTATFWAPMAEKQIIVVKNSTENHRQFDRMGMRTFTVSGAATAQDVGQYIMLLRTVFEIRFLHPRRGDNSFVARAPIPVLDAATVCVEGLTRPRLQVMLDIDVYQIDHQLARNIGLHIPNTFNLFNIPAAALAAIATAAGGQNIQSLINQLISGGGINGADSQSIQGLLSQLQNQSSGIFSQPLATFGGGLTFMGLSLDTLSAQLSLNESWVRALDHATLRAEAGGDTTFRMGQRYPVVNASFAPVFNTSAISQVLQNGSFQAPIPSFSYEDLGLDIKAKPLVASNSNVALDLEMQLRSLAGTSENGVPVISNRQYKGSINLRDGEPAVVASAITRSDLLTITGLPGFGSIPGLNRLATMENKSVEDDELLILITPHIVELDESKNTEVWLGN